jgi:hypothetical protein
MPLASYSIIICIKLRLHSNREKKCDKKSVESKRSSQELLLSLSHLMSEHRLFVFMKKIFASLWQGNNAMISNLLKGLFSKMRLTINNQLQNKSNRVYHYSASHSLFIRLLALLEMAPKRKVGEFRYDMKKSNKSRARV